MHKGVESIYLNGIYRGKHLGTISSLNEYLTFRTAHGIDTKEYKDIYIGDRIKINDGTYNITWVVTHFDYYYNLGGTIPSSKGIVLMPASMVTTSKMNNENTTAGGYTATIAHSTTCPAVASALQSVLGSYLQTYRILATTDMNSSAASMAGANWVGAATGFGWQLVNCSLPGEIQIYGSTVYSSSYYDVGESFEKFALFNFVNPIYYNKNSYWLRTIASSLRFTAVSADGHSHTEAASASLPIRPIIYIG